MKKGSALRTHSSLLTALILAVNACSNDASKARIGIAVEPGWYAAVQLAQENLRDVPIEWISDSGRNVQAASSALEYADWLVSEGVVAVVGHSGSRGSVAAGTVYAQHGIVQVAPIATSRALTRTGGRAYGLVPDDSTEGAFIAAFVDSALHSRRVALLYHQDEFGHGIRDGVVAEFDRRRITGVDERFFSPEGAPGPSVDVATLLTAALRKNPDVLILGARIEQTRAVARHLRGLGRKIAVVCSDGSYVLPPGRSPRELGELEGFYIAHFWSPRRDSSAAAFARVFEGRFGYVPDQAEALTYDAIMLVGAAVREGARSSAELQRTLGSYGWGRPAHQGLAVTDLAFTGLRPRASSLAMGIVAGGVLNPLASGTTR